MNVKPHTRSFAGGEITPELYGRLDLAKFQTGLAKALNFWVLPHGPVQNRPGFAYVNEAKHADRACRLIPFSYNTEQTFVIEVGHQYIRWHTMGATLLESSQAPSAISVASPAVWSLNAHGYTAGQWLFVTGVTGTFGARVNDRFLKVVNPAANTFELTDLAGNAINSTGFTVTGAGTVARVYEISTTYDEDDLMDLHFTQSNDILTITHPSYPPRQLSRAGATNWSIADISFVPTITTPNAPTLTEALGTGTPIDVSYKITALAADTLEESLPSNAATINTDLTVAGNYVNVDITTVSGAVRYNIYKLTNGLYGYIGQSDGSDFRDNNITPDVSKTPAEPNNPFGSANNYPDAVGYYEGRRVFGGTANKPQNYWLTRSGTESNLSYSIPTRDDDLIQGKAKGNEVNAIHHVVSTNEQLLFLTSGGVWKLTPSNSDILTPTSALPKQISAEGASSAQPVKTADEVIYVGESESRLFTVRYKWESNGLVADDLTLMAPHLFDDYTFADITYSKGLKMVWSVRSDGKLIGTTYLPRHEVNAMHQHDTRGGEDLFESVCSVKEGREYPVYAMIQRTLNGRTVRTIERMHTRRFTDLEDCFFVDCGVTYDSVPTTTVRAWHLIGEEVAILADGAEVANQIVASDGVITLDIEASKIHVGLPIIADVQGLPLVLEAVSAFGQANLKNMSEVSLRVRDSSGIKAGPSFDNLRELPARSNENYDTPPRLKNGVVQITLDNEWDIDTQICIRQDTPLPLTIAAMTLSVKTGG